MGKHGGIRRFPDKWTNAPERKGGEALNSMLVGYLGRVARIGCPEEGNIERLECAVALLVDESELPRTVAEAVNRYVNDPSAAGSLVVASSIVHAGLWEVGVDGIVQRLAVAYKDGELTAAATAELLSLIPLRSANGSACRHAPWLRRQTWSSKTIEKDGIAPTATTPSEMQSMLSSIRA